MPTLKEQLHDLCAQYISKRETEIKKIISDARESANNETKSSAGDKYETGREVMQQEIDLNMTRLNEINKLKVAFERIAPDHKSDTAQPGSLVHTTNGSYYIAISAGQLKLDDVTYYAISAASPVGVQLMGRQAGDDILLNGKKIKVNEVN